MTPAPDPARTGASYACVLAADPFAVRASLAKLATAAPFSGLADDHRATAEIVLAEVLNNIAEHAYADGAGQIEVTLHLTGAGLVCLVTDDGAAMPDGRLPDGDLPALGQGLSDLPLADLPEGGFGWHLIRILTRDLSYDRVAGQNRLSFLIPA